MRIYDPLKIIALREQKGLNMSELAKRAKISAPSMWAIEHGVTEMPRASTLLDIAKALGVTLSEIMSHQPVDDVIGKIQAAVAILPPDRQAAILAAALSLAEQPQKPRK